MMWFYTQDGEERFGPVAPAEFDELVRSGVIMPETQVWREGMPEWQPWSLACATNPPILIARPEPAEQTSSAEEPPLELSFTGSAPEYFRVWIVNIVLTIVTFGIFAAWAKVRTKRYFYANTSLAGHAFEYLADPKRILIGNLVVGALFIGYNVSAAVSPLLQLAMMVPIMIAVPWLIAKAILFNARNSAWRGLRFGFAGGYADALILYVVLPMLVPFTLGLIWPYIAKRRRAWAARNHRFGTTPFEFSGQVADYYLIYLKGLVFFVPLIVAYGLFIASAVRMGWATRDGGPPPESLLSEFASDPGFRMVIMLNMVLVGFICIILGMKMRSARRLLVVPAAMLIGGLLWGGMQRAGFKSPETMIAGLLFLGSVLCAYVGAMYLRARLFTYNWHNTTLGPHVFIASMRARDLIGLQLGNVFVTAITFGLAWPWAAVRTARFQLECLQLVRGGDLDAFVGESRPSPGAIGEAAGDFLELDIGFGV